MPEHPTADRGKCITCGFLSKHPRAGISGLPAPRYYEIERQERIGNHEQMFTYQPDLANIRRIKTGLACFIDQADLMAGVPGDDANTMEAYQITRDAGAEVIALDRHCNGWYPYKPGFSPREHYDRLEMQRLELDRRAFETKLFEMGQQAQQTSIQIAQDSKAIVGDLKVIAEKNDTFSRRVTVWVILLAVLQVIGALVALPSISWVQRLWHYIFR